MPKRREFLQGAAALAALPSRSLAAAPLPVVRVGMYSAGIFYLPMWIAIEKGFFKQEGVDFDLVDSPSQAASVDAMLDGGMPVAMPGPEVAFHDKADKDRVRIIAGNAERPPHFLIAQSRFKTVSDLRGATIGVISLTEGTTFLAQKMCAAAGLKRADYTIIAAGGAGARSKLMDEGKIDACLQPFPLSYQAEAKGFSNLGWVGKQEPDWQFGVMVANRAWLDGNVDTAARMLRGGIRGRRFMDEHRGEAAEIAARRMDTTVALTRRAIDDCLRLRIMDPNLHWSEHGMEEVYKAVQQAGMLPADRPFRVLDYVDPRPLSLAMKSV